MGESQAEAALLSVCLVVAEHYMAEPVPDLDPLVSEFSGYNVRRVPVIRYQSRPVLFTVVAKQGVRVHPCRADGLPPPARHLPLPVRPPARGGEGG